MAVLSGRTSPRLWSIAIRTSGTSNPIYGKIELSLPRWCTSSALQVRKRTLGQRFLMPKLQAIVLLCSGHSKRDSIPKAESLMALRDCHPRSRSPLRFRAIDVPVVPGSAACKAASLPLRLRHSPRKWRSASLPNQIHLQGYRQLNDKLKNSEVPSAIWERCCHVCLRP